MAKRKLLHKINIHLMVLLVLISAFFLVQHYRWNKEMERCERALDEHLKQIESATKEQ